MGIEDLNWILPEDESKFLGNKLELEWMKEIQKSNDGLTYKPSLIKAIARAFGPGIANLGLLVFLEEFIFRIFSPLLMSWFIRYFSSKGHSGISYYEVSSYGIGIVLVAALSIIISHQFFFKMMQTGMKLRVAHCSLIYRKVCIIIFTLEITLCSQRCDYSQKVRTFSAVHYIKRVIMALELFPFHS